MSRGCYFRLAFHCWLLVNGTVISVIIQIVASPQTSFGVRLSRTPKDVCGEAIQIVDKLITNSETRDDNNNRVTLTVKC